MSLDVASMARELLSAYDDPHPLPAALSTQYPGLDLATAYAVEAELTRLRRASGRRTVGLKVGFANKAMWRILKLDTLVWGHMYDNTVHLFDRPSMTHSLAGRLAPRIEPEIVFKLARPIEPGQTDPAAILDAVEWMALGYEINDCVFPDWKFQPVDFVAAFGFHTALVVGPHRAVTAADADALAKFTLKLSKNGTLVEEGAGKAALRSPALCLGELASAIARQSFTAPLAAGDLVSTGTLTTPQPIAPGDTWTADVDGIALEAISLALT